MHATGEISRKQALVFVTAQKRSLINGKEKSCGRTGKLVKQPDAELKYLA
jgi:hypothetical protein